jgi:hypothetical protein
MPLKDIRRRLYRGLSDEQIISRVRALAASEEQRVVGDRRNSITNPENLTLGLLGTETARAKVAVLMDEIEQVQTARMASLESDQRTVIVSGVVAWVTPVVLLFTFGPRVLRPRRTLQRF